MLEIDNDIKCTLFKKVLNSKPVSNRHSQEHLIITTDLLNQSSTVAESFNVLDSVLENKSESDKEVIIKAFALIDIDQSRFLADRHGMSSLFE